MNYPMRRLSYIFLCITPILFIATAVRPFRIPGLYQTIAAVQFTAICIAAWMLGARVVRSGAEGEQNLALAGGLLVAPFALGSLVFVGLGTPWEATPAENETRYLVLLVMSIIVTAGFVVLKETLNEAGERFYSTLGLATNILAGAAYLIWMTFLLGAYFAKVHNEQVASINELSVVLDILLDTACVLTYLTTAAFAASLGRIGWLGRIASRAYMIASLVALLFLVMRGLAFPDPNALSTPWFTRPGFIAGIPAVPWIMPFLLGVVLLRRAGNEQL
jgi:hypothetical protein